MEKAIDLWTATDTNLNPTPRKLLFNLTPKKLLDGENKLNLCRKILSNPLHYSEGLHEVAKAIWRSEGRLSVKQALKYIKWLKKYKKIQ